MAQEQEKISREKKKALLKRLKEHCQGMVFLISHRSSTMACADRIFRLEAEQLVKER
ncbi:TPA: hypothetical protein TZ315_001976 [Streptococcus suis]|nr:hypothetical protein [Streptococcus suis]HEP1836688.1 hypothetical protein [Streptococcus suis]